MVVQQTSARSVPRRQPYATGISKAVVLKHSCLQQQHTAALVTSLAATCWPCTGAARRPDLVLHLMQISNHQHFANRVDRADQLPGSQLCSGSETRLHGTQDEADCKGRPTSDHLLCKELHCPVLHLEGSPKSAGNGLQACVCSIAGLRNGSPDAFYHCCRLQRDSGQASAPCLMYSYLSIDYARNMGAAVDLACKVVSA